MLSISESIDDMEAYTQLTDQVYYQILYSTDPALEEVSFDKLLRSFLFRFVELRTLEQNLVWLWEISFTANYG